MGHRMTKKFPFWCRCDVPVSDSTTKISSQVRFLSILKTYVKCIKGTLKTGLELFLRAPVGR
jgi:hypothetical protein